MNLTITKSTSLPRPRITYHEAHRSRLLLLAIATDDWPGHESLPEAYQVVQATLTWSR